MLFATCAVVLTASPAAVASRPAVASQLGLDSVEVHYALDGRVSLARGNLGALPNDATQFLRERAAPLGLRDDEALVVLKDERTSEGARHVRISRTLGGIPVAFDQLRVHARPDGEAYALEAETSALEGFVYRPPSLLPDEAVKRASGGYQGLWAEPPRSKLMILGSRFEGVGPPRLTYRVLVAYPRDPGQVPVREEVYVDAHSGQVVARLSRVRTADGTPVTVNAVDLFGHQVSLNATKSPEGILLEDEVTLDGGQLFTVAGDHDYSIYLASGAPPTISDRQAVSVADNVRRAIRFDLDTFGWNRWDFNQTPTGVGGAFLGVTHVGDHLANAYFTVLTGDGVQLGSVNFGDGDGDLLLDTARCLDVAGHEIGHGIVESTASLVYHNQPGALNEHYADMFGWMLDSTNDTIGEQCVGPAIAPKVLRDLCDPGNAATVYQPQPATMGQYRSLGDTQSTDWGGVHINSGIPNHAACLYRNGTDFATLGKVWFRALSMHLGPTTDFQGMAQATMTSCAELGLSSCATLDAAWTAVGVPPPSSGVCPPNSTQQANQCVCNYGYHFNSARTGCEPDLICPVHAHAYQGYCYCDDGYTHATSGAECVPESSSGVCGEHAHSAGGKCVCDTCFQYATLDATVCTPIPNCAVCTGPLQQSSNGVCVCEAGTQPVGQDCEPIAGDCGKENFAGRCSGNTLVYCNDKVVPKVIRVTDCAQLPATPACGLSKDGYDCIPKSSDCGSVPDTGACVGNTAQRCNAGVLETIDCKENGCRSYTSGGYTVNGCYPCPPHAVYADAAGTCSCEAGYVKSTAGTSCVAAGAVSTGGGSEKSNTTKSGCSAVGEPFLGLALVGLGLLSRRRRCAS